ncbi:MAG: His/Gly/Thr/Pro-type tRNA ligase C-terminal domain-containing protein, partial [Promethearchaeota archaeon]
YGALIAYLGDDKGLVLPFDLAPIQIVIIPIIVKGKEKEVLEKCKKVANELNLKFRVKLDESEGSPGSKFYLWEMKGVPIRIEIGPKDLEKNQVVIVKRHDGKKLFIKESDLNKKIDDIAKNFTKEIKKKSLLDFEDQIEVCHERDSAKEAIENGKIVCCGFCSIAMKGYHCAEIIEKEVGGFIRGKKVGEEKHEFASCIICGEPAQCTVYIAKSY